MHPDSPLSTLHSQLSAAGIVLCGGRSSRMGRPKAWLPFGDETMLQRVVRTLSTAVHPVVVVAAPGQKLPPLPGHVLIVHDQQEGLGPLAGLAAALSALLEVVDAAYVSSCDVPLLTSEFAHEVIRHLGDAEVAIPFDGDRYYPLAAVYRTTLADRCVEMLARGDRRALDLVHHARSYEIPVDTLRNVDPGLVSLRNVNTPEEYAAALKDAGIAS